MPSTMRRTVNGDSPASIEIGRHPLPPCRRNRLYRRGFTLVELLAVIATIGALVALLLPAVSAQRETARKTQCASRMKQVGLGLQAHHAAHSKLPSGHVAYLERGYDGKSWGWAALLLPFVEEHALSDQLDPTRRSFDEVASDPERAPYLLTNLNVYRCPSDAEGELSHRLRSIFLPYSVGEQFSWSPAPRNLFPAGGPVLAHAFAPPTPPTPTDPWGGDFTVGVQIGKSNFIASHGSRWKLQWDDWRDEDFRGDGLFGRNSEVRHSEITDGASKTLAVGERSYRNYAAVWAGGNSWEQCGFVDNQMVLGTAQYPINDPPLRFNIDCDGQGSANYGSYHRGGANFLFADGSVRFLAEEIDLPTFQRMARRDDGENVGDF